jgi:drug/metabolite transporter (DMT)-like permease
MFEKTELEIWWDRLDPKTKDYLKSQPLWHNSDLYKALAVGVCIGFIVGIIFGYEIGFTPAAQATTYLKG